ncbi:MAG: cation diffusion facilitator family transporter [Leptolyngbya sp.]|nr:cation diffusion facilitator family transporter [Leptolyngbya sp.]
MVHHHHHGHGHHQGHHDHHSPQHYTRAFQIGIVLNVGFVAIEAAFGWMTQSLALLADAGHNLSDVLGLLLAWGARYLALRPPSPTYTYGLRRSPILAALLNSMLLLLAVGGIAWEALRRLQDPSPVPGSTLIWVAGVGIGINTLTALLFFSGRHHDLNIRGAFLHMAADALVSVGVVLAGVAILLTGWLWLDPVIGLGIVGVIVWGTWSLFRDALGLILDRVPKHIEPLAVRTFLQDLPGVEAVHDLHIWAMSTTETALTAHLVMPAGSPGDVFLAQVSDDLHHRFTIAHATLQIETGDAEFPCRLEPDHHV